MSYDVMVFDPMDAPRERKNFIEWFERTIGWSEGHDYNDPNATTSQLRAWYDDIRKSSRNMNRPGTPTNDEILIVGIEGHLADYSFGHHATCTTLAWSEAKNVYPIFPQLAAKYNVGFYDVSGDEGNGEIHFLGDQLRLSSGGAWHDVAKQFKEMSKQ